MDSCGIIPISWKISNTMIKIFESVTVGSYGVVVIQTSPHVVRFMYVISQWWVGLPITEQPGKPCSTAVERARSVEPCGHSNGQQDLPEVRSRISHPCVMTMGATATEEDEGVEGHQAGREMLTDTIAMMSSTLVQEGMLTMEGESHLYVFHLE